MEIWRPIIAEPPLCKLHELEDGTYSIDDLADLHEALDLKEEIQRKQKLRKQKRKK